jgi:hypothetical protein
MTNRRFGRDRTRSPVEYLVTGLNTEIDEDEMPIDMNLQVNYDPRVFPPELMSRIFLESFGIIPTNEVSQVLPNRYSVFFASNVLTL